MLSNWVLAAFDQESVRTNPLPKAVVLLKKENGAVYVTPIIIIKNKYKSIQRMAKNTALFKENWDMGKAIPTLQDLLDKQVFDNRKQIEHEE